MMCLLGALLATAQLAGCQAAEPPDEEESRRRRAWWAVETATRECMREAGVEGYELVPPWGAAAGPHTAAEWLAGRRSAHREHDAEVLLGRRDSTSRVDTRGLGADELWRATGCLGQAFHEVGID
jgi:hypothetical protein